MLKSKVVSIVIIILILNETKVICSRSSSSSENDYSIENIMEIEDCNQLFCNENFKVIKKDNRRQKLKDFIKNTFQKQKERIKLAKLKVLLTLRY